MHDNSKNNLEGEKEKHCGRGEKRSENIVGEREKTGKISRKQRKTAKNNN